MAGIAETFGSASFFGVEFPYSERSIKCALRHHTHEYPHADGGDDEPLGRRLYEFGFTSDFDTGFEGRFPRLYPAGLQLLFEVFGQGIVAELKVPGFGSWQARCIDWDARKAARIKSGERLTMKFLEVMPIDVVEQNFTTAPLALPALADKLYANIVTLSKASVGILPKNAIPKLSDLNTILGIVAILSALPSISPAISIEASALLFACQTYDGLPFMRYPRSYATANSLHELYLASLKILKDALLKGRAILTFITNIPKMSISQVATVVYGSTARTAELMQLNNLPDALNITSGTPIRYYQA